MPSRRTFLALVTALAGLPLAGGPVAALVPAGPEVRRYGRHYLVNGWILTAADLEALGLHAG